MHCDTQYRSALFVLASYISKMALTGQFAIVVPAEVCDWLSLLSEGPISAPAPPFVCPAHALHRLLFAAHHNLQTIKHNYGLPSPHPIPGLDELYAIRYQYFRNRDICTFVNIL